MNTDELAAPRPRVESSVRQQLARIHAWAAAFGAVSIFLGSLCSDWLSPQLCVEAIVLAGLFLILPIWWVVVACLASRKRYVPDAPWWWWLTLPIVLAGTWYGRDLALGARVRLNDAAFVAMGERADQRKAADAAAASPTAPPFFVKETGDIGWIHVRHVAPRREGWYFCTARAPDGEMGLFRSRNGEPPRTKPGDFEWHTFRHLSGPWWRYTWDSQ